MTLRTRARVRDWEVILARVRMFGFRVEDDHRVWIDLEREDRRSRISLVGEVQIDARDPRDRWLLQEAVGGDGGWAARTTYFYYRASDDEVMPVELRLGLGSGEDAMPFIEEDMLDGRIRRMVVKNVEDLMDALPPLGPSNSVGYFTARNHVLDAFQNLRPKTWADLGITDAAEIAEYELHSVNADHVAHARAGGLKTQDEIIRGYGIPPDAGWVPVEIDDGD